MIGNQVLELIQDQLYLSDYQPGSFVHVACGRDVKPSFFRDLKFKNVFLVDGNPDVCRYLREEQSLGDSVQILEHLISEIDGYKKFYLTNNERFDSLTDPSNLRGYFKNLRVVGSEQKKTLSVASLLAKINADSEKFNILLLESIGRSMALLGSIDQEVLKLYSIVGVKLDLETAKKQAGLNSLLTKRGYRLLLVDRQDFPFEFRVYVRSEDLIRINALTDENRALREENESLARKIRSLIENQFPNELLIASEKLERMEKLLSEKVEGVVTRLDKRLDRKFFNSVLRLESSIALQNYFSSTGFNGAFQGWAISSDVAAYLLEKIEDNSYDLIIEFGSGSSTSLFANAISTKNPQVESSGQKSTTSKAVVAIEHNEFYLDKTAGQLERLDLRDYVSLVHAPLIDVVVDGDDYRYYNCESVLAEISENSAGSVKKILILVDGPPGDTGHCARFPALPLALKHLGMHQIDFVLDDYARPEEKEVVEKWKCYLERNEMSVTEEIFRCEKGVYFCRVPPQ